MDVESGPGPGRVTGTNMVCPTCSTVSRHPMNNKPNKAMEGIKTELMDFREFIFIFFEQSLLSVLN